MASLWSSTLTLIPGQAFRVISMRQPTARPAWVNPVPPERVFACSDPHARGGIGTVSVALDAELNREVALKQILPEQADNLASRSRFLLEAEVTARLEHPGVVPVYGLGMSKDARPFYAMRLVRGETLKEAVERFRASAAQPGRDRSEQALDLRHLLARFQGVCNTVAYAHSRGVIHRDLKPSNIMLGPTVRRSSSTGVSPR